MMTEPVLLIGFNRPEHLSRVIDRIRTVQPTRVFVAIDGPRPERKGEQRRVQDCQQLVSTIDWPCDVSTLFHDQNLGCGLGVSTAISWFFRHVERGIILEDDILPSPDFFPFCTQLLDRYADDPRVFAVSGCNFVPTEAQSRPDLPYRFSRVPHIWGWATWRRSWATHQLDVRGWRRRLPLRRLWSRAGYSLPSVVYWASTFELLARNEVDTWDGQLVLAAMVEDCWTATSNVNLIENIGFGVDATHTLEDRNELAPPGTLVFPLTDVPVTPDTAADAWTRRHHFRATWGGLAGQAGRYLRAR